MKTVIIIGAGPAGLTAGVLLAEAGYQVTVLEADSEYVGGISRTARYKGYHFDIGGHRFFSKSREVEDFWTRMLGDDMLHRPRKSRIFYNGKFYSYPLKAFEALRNLGLLESGLCMLSYAGAKLFPKKDPKNFEEWVSNQFGSRLYRMFFKTYTEKVWGMDCTEISADWAAQRIKGLSLWEAVKNAFLPAANQSKDRSKVIKTLIDTFRYPRKGPGMMWEACAERIRSLGGEIIMGAKVTGIRCGEEHTVVYQKDQLSQEIKGVELISTMPLRELIAGMSPEPPDEVKMAAQSLKYRDFLTVVLMLRGPGQFDDNWIYIHDKSVKVGRIQNFKSWSPEMVPDENTSCYGLEYFCFEGDGLWTMSDEELIRMGQEELIRMGLAGEAQFIDGCVVRQPKAYPVYDDLYREHTAVIGAYLDRVRGLQVTGRNGMHRYNNQDHSMMTAMLAVKNILAGKPMYNLWNVNQDAEYHESGIAGESDELGSTGRMVPRRA